MPKLPANHPARVAQEAEQARKDFWLELDHRCLDKGLAPGSTALSRFADVQSKTIRAYRQGERAMQLDTLQMWIKALSPDIRVVLRFLGYTDKEIKTFAKGVTQ